MWICFIAELKYLLDQNMREFFFFFFGSVRLGGVGGAAGDNTSVAAQITPRPVEATPASSRI